MLFPLFSDTKQNYPKKLSRFIQIKQKNLTSETLCKHRITPESEQKQTVSVFCFTYIRLFHPHRQGYRVWQIAKCLANGANKNAICLAHALSTGLNTLFMLVSHVCLLYSFKLYLPIPIFNLVSLMYYVLEKTSDVPSMLNCSY